MTVTDVEIRPFDAETAGEEEFAALNRYNNVMKAERAPTDPPETLAHTKLNVRNIPPFVNFHSWNVWDGDEIVGRGEAVTLKETVPENQHIVQCMLGVLPDYRRHGIGTRLLRLVADVARSEGRSLFLLNTTSSVPAGEAYAERLGATMALPMHYNELDMRDLNRDLVRLWQERALERAADFDLEVIEGAYPEDQLEEIAQAYESMNLAPRGELDVEDFHWTPEQLRQMDESDAQRGVEHWTMIVRDRSTGRIAGLTDVYWNPEQPTLLSQNLTAVFKEYQNRGLGRWLKAAMIDKVLRERPQVERIRTGNAYVNEPMLHINTELGFKPLRSECLWQVELDKVLAYLASRPTPAAV